MRNENRAEWGRRAIMHGNPDTDEADEQTALVDTLANMLHAADAQGLNFDVALGSARMHYEAEEAERDDLDAGDIDIRPPAEDSAVLDALQRLVDCPDYRGIGTLEMNHARRIIKRYQR